MLLDQWIARRTIRQRKPKKSRQVRVRSTIGKKKSRKRRHSSSIKTKIYFLSFTVLALYAVISFLVLNPRFKKVPKHTVQDYLRRIRTDGKVPEIHRHKNPNLKNKNNDDKREPEIERTDFQISEMPNHCNATKSIKEVIIKGERHCGTNWVRAIMEKNVVNGSVVLDQASLDIGWKHGFLPPKGWGKPIEENEILLVVTRDVFTWLPKMYQWTYDPEMNEKTKSMSFSNFIRTPYTARCHPLSGQIAEQSKYQIPFCNSLPQTWYEMLVGTAIAEKAPNLIEIRTRKYKQWLSEDLNEPTFDGSKEKFLQQRMHVRLEGVISNGQKAEVGDRLASRCVPVYQDFHDVIERTKWKGWKEKILKGKRYNAKSERRKLLRRYSHEDLRYVLSQLDLEFEKSIGYDYDYIHEMLDQPEVPYHRRNLPMFGKFDKGNRKKRVKGELLDLAHKRKQRVAQWG